DSGKITAAVYCKSSDRIHVTASPEHPEDADNIVAIVGHVGIEALPAITEPTDQPEPRIAAQVEPTIVEPIKAPVIAIETVTDETPTSAVVAEKPTEPTATRVRRLTNPKDQPLLQCNPVAISVHQNHFSSAEQALNRAIANGEISGAMVTKAGCFFQFGATPDNPDDLANIVEIVAEAVVDKGTDKVPAFRMLCRVPMDLDGEIKVDNKALVVSKTTMITRGFDFRARALTVEVPFYAEDKTDKMCQRLRHFDLILDENGNVTLVEKLEMELVFTNRWDTATHIKGDGGAFADARNAFAERIYVLIGETIAIANDERRKYKRRQGMMGTALEAASKLRHKAAG
ncbi:MAG: hypothetical protein Q7R41_13780, partial [Phycisphaerales bacterium]|nr:hypothetical protein [Phycisphaerales bacterium]